MLKKNFLILGTMSLLLTSTLLGNEIAPCEHCFADLSSLSTSVKVVEEEKHFTAVKLVDLSSVDSEVVLSESADENEIIIELMEEIDNVLAENSDLPVAKFFCENNKIALYEGDSELFTCV